MPVKKNNATAAGMVDKLRPLMALYHKDHRGGDVKAEQTASVCFAQQTVHRTGGKIASETKVMVAL